MAFRFSLASVLSFRESIEKREELALQKVQLEVARVLRSIDKLTADLIDALDARDRALQTPTPAFYLQGMQEEMAAAILAKQNLSATLQSLKREREKQIAVYQAAHRNRELLTDLLTQQKNTWEQKQLKTQQKSLDDIFAARAQRE